MTVVEGLDTWKCAQVRSAFTRVERHDGAWVPDPATIRRSQQRSGAGERLGAAKGSLAAHGETRMSRTGKPSSQLRKDLGVFFDGGFVLAVGLCLLLAVLAAALMLVASYKFGIPPIILS